MFNDLESLLIANCQELYLQIKEKSVEELKLPVSRLQKIVGFGKLSDFYMFWISLINETLYFNARKSFTKSLTDNVIRIEFKDDNLQNILQAIDEIYNDYLHPKINNAISTKTEKEIVNNPVKPARKEIKTLSPTQLLWKDVTAKFVEKNAQFKFEKEFDENTSIKLQTYGKRIVELYEEIFHITEERFYNRDPRNFFIYRDRVETDSVTLAEIATNYNLSRERIRQICDHIDNNLSKHFKKALSKNNEELEEHVQQVARIFAEIDYEFVYLSAYGMTHISMRKKEAIFNLFFGKNLSQKIIDSSRSLLQFLKEKNKVLQIEKKILEDWKVFETKFYFPSNLLADQKHPIATLQKDYNFHFENKFYEKIRKFERIVDIIKNPDIVFYSTNQTDHRPHFLLRLSNGKSVLILLLPTINMGFAYNLERFNALHNFCTENGYGYLITDDRGNSIYDIKNKIIDEELVKTLDNILNTKNFISWRDIKDIKLTRSVANIDIVAYVLQNKLRFSMSPFSIRRRKQRKSR